MPIQVFEWALFLYDWIELNKLVLKPDTRPILLATHHTIHQGLLWL